MLKKADYRLRKLRICYLNSQPRIVAVSKLSLEKMLQQLAQIELIEIKTLHDPALNPCDLLVVAAESIPEDEFLKWLRRFSKSISLQGNIWIPAIIFSNTSFKLLQSFFDEAHKMNWYFDILSSEELNSLPMRVANLLRIHDHLHELTRYRRELDELNDKILELSLIIQKLKPDDG